MKFINKLKIYPIYIVVGFLAWTGIAQADLSINEIMYDGAGADIDWLEVYNSGTEDVDLTAIKLMISNSTSNHEINGQNGAKNIKPGGYGVIVVNSQLSDFTKVWQGSSSIFTSAFSLPNLQDDTSASISINKGDKNAPIDSVTYSKENGASNNGQSLQLIGTNWQESMPTPNRENYLNQVNNESIETDNQNMTTSTTSSTSKSATSTNSVNKKEIVEELKIFTKIITHNVVVAGVSFDFESETKTNRNTTLMTGRYVWNFGDGTKNEFVNANLFSHIYYYPGEYLVNLFYYESKGSFKPIATDRLVIKVLSPSVAISSVGGLLDPYIELENKSVYEFNLSGWTISSMNHYFFIPDQTFLLPNKKIKLSHLVTGFNQNDLSYLMIKNPAGEIVDNFPRLVVQTGKIPVSKISSQNKIITRTIPDTPQVVSLKEMNKEKEETNVIDLSNLSANSSSTAIKIPNQIYSLVGLLVIIIIAMVSFIFIKKTKDIAQNDDKSIKADDFTIVE